MRREIFVHAGAHRTGTSSFQLCLSENQSVLKASGFNVAFPGRDGVAGGRLKLRLPRPRHGPDEMDFFVGKAARTLMDHVSDNKNPLVLSEENLPGVILHFFKGRLYPNRKRRLQVFRKAIESIDCRVAHVLFVIRPYDQLFMSGFRKHAEDNPVQDFADHAEAMSKFSGGWPETVQSLRNVLAPDRLSVVEFGARGQSRDLLGRLLDDAPERFSEPQRGLNISATDAALEHLQSLYHSGVNLSRAEWQKVIGDFADETDDRGFTSFSKAQLERFSTRYAADLERLAGMNGVTLIGC